MLKPRYFQQRILKWFNHEGRKDLPWQQNPTPYRVWISEIMLQQTQVTTVIPYFQRFMQRFPTIKSLASAEMDEVLALWSGLGYYARGRNLHRSAQQIMAEHKGKMPTELEALQSLPGIGRSTAGAIISLSGQGFATILDGNVKRVLCRCFGVKGWPGETRVHNQLWDIAESYTPTQNAKDFNQAMMDMGAMICTRSQPRCDNCPIASHCYAYKGNVVKDFPGKKPKKVLPVKKTQMVILQNQHKQILLVQRPDRGIWGKLWCFPECPIEQEHLAWFKQQYGSAARTKKILPEFRHTFSHYHLDITPILVSTAKSVNIADKPAGHCWYQLGTPPPGGIPRPVERILRSVEEKA